MSTNQFEKNEVGEQILDSELRKKLDQDPAELQLNYEEKQSFFDRNKIYIFLAVFALAVLSALSYIAFTGTAPQQVEANIDLLVDVPENITTGSESIFKVEIKNNDSATLEKGVLEIKYPSGVSFVSSEPKADNLSGTQIQIPKIPSGVGVTVFIKTRVLSSLGSEKGISVKYSYTQSGFTSGFSKSAEGKFGIKSSAILLNLNGPKEISTGEDASYMITYKNTSSETLVDAKVVVDYPDDFNFKSSDVKPTLAKNTWELGQLPPGQDGAINLVGDFKAASPGQAKTFTVEIQSKDQSGKYFTQNKTEFRSGLSVVPLLASQSVNGDKLIAAPGETLEYVLKYKNTSSIAARGVKVTLSLDGQGLDMSSAKTIGGSVVGSDVIWTASENQSLANVLPGTSGELRFTVSLKNPATKDQSKNLIITSKLKISSAEYPTAFSGNEVQVKIATQVSLNSALSVTSGPKPPKFGEEGVYKVTLNLKNSSNELKDGSVTLTVPSAVSSFDPKSVIAAAGDKVEFDAATGKLTWRFPKAETFIGIFSPAKSLTFTVKMTPNTSQVGQPLVLAKGITLTATDTHTNQTLTLKSQDITTSSGGADGVVVQ